MVRSSAASFVRVGRSFLDPTLAQYCFLVKFRDSGPPSFNPHSPDSIRSNFPLLPGRAQHTQWPAARLAIVSSAVAVGRNPGGHIPSRVHTYPFLVFPILLSAAVLTQSSPNTSDPSLRAPEDPEATIVMAERAINDGRPWQATELLDSLVRRPELQSPRLLIVAARAAARWGGWTRVEELLAGARWLDSLGGEGHALLARAALARGDPRAGGTHARAAVRVATEETLGERLVLTARSFDQMSRRDAAARAALRDSAAHSYRRAAEALPLIRDWLVLRAVGVTDDSAQRAKYLSAITITPALQRRGWANAAGAEGAEQWAEASRLYLALGAKFRATAVRLKGTEGRAGRPAVRRELLQALEGRLGPDDTRTVIDLLDLYFAPLDSAEELLVARRAAVSGTATRAAAGYERVATAGALDDEDRFRFGTVLVRLGRNREAIAQFELVGTARRGEAAYQAARTRMRMGEVTAAMGELGSVIRTYGPDPEAAGTALYLLGDLLNDRGDDSAARASFRQLALRYPGHRLAESGRLRAALLAYHSGDASTAAAELDELRSLGGAETEAATYWAGRAWARTGDSAAASVRWAAAASMKNEYYAHLAVQALGRRGWHPPANIDSRPHLEWLEDALVRVDLLEALSLSSEASHELRWIRDRAESSVDAMVETARVVDSAGRHDIAVRLAIRAQGRGAGSDRVLVRLLYPMPFANLLASEANRQGLDPMLVASIIRQESAFDPKARSGADARGLMQVLPSVGRQLAPRLGIRGFEPILLYQPEVNLRMGTVHLAASLREYSRLVHALAAYNAGGTRVKRWLETAGTDDPEWFVERIPIPETRDYVRRILVNLARYEVIHSDK